MRNTAAAASLTIVLALSALGATAGELVTISVAIPFIATADQEILYEPSEKAYKKAYTAKVADLRAGKASACVNDADGPWMHVETDAKVGLDVEGIGAMKGRKHVRQVSAADQAIFDLEQEGVKLPCG